MQACRASITKIRTKSSFGMSAALSCSGYLLLCVSCSLACLLACSIACLIGCVFICVFVCLFACLFACLLLLLSLIVCLLRVSFFVGECCFRPLVCPTYTSNSWPNIRFVFRARAIKHTETLRVPSKSLHNLCQTTRAGTLVTVSRLHTYT